MSNPFPPAVLVLFVLIFIAGFFAGNIVFNLQQQEEARIYARGAAPNGR